MPYFGTSLPDGSPEAGFFAKELAEDLKTCDVISSFSDEEEYCVVGRGALEALQLMFDQDSLPQRHALQLIIALLPHARSGWRGQRPLGLHDVQFMLCQFGGLLKGTMRPRMVLSSREKLIREHVANAFALMADGQGSIEVMSASFRAFLEDMPDVHVVQPSA